jgi:hypothetical protein
MTRPALPHDLFDQEEEVPLSEAARNMLAFASPKIVSMERKRKFAASRTQVSAARGEMERRTSSGDWDGASPAAFVALYEWLHRCVYGVDAGDLDPRGWAFATSSARRMVEKDFGGDAAEAVAFMKWVWKREDGREKWRRENGRDGQTIGWRQLFGAGYLRTDYRISKARRS